MKALFDFVFVTILSAACALFFGVVLYGAASLAGQNPDIAGFFFFPLFGFLAFMGLAIQNSNRGVPLSTTSKQHIRVALYFSLAPIIALIVSLLWKYVLAFYISFYAALGLLYLLSAWGQHANPSSHIRGSLLLSIEDAKKRAADLLKNSEPEVFWGCFHLPMSVGEGNFCVVGAPGSGKTLTLRLFMQSVLGHIKKGSDQRAIIYDNKRDHFPILSGLNLSVPIILANPFDTRSSAWDMAVDINSPASAESLANILVPSTQESQPYFTQAVRDLLYNVLLNFIRDLQARRSKDPNAPHWTFRDLLCALQSPRSLKAVLQTRPDTDAVYRLFSEKESTFQDILSTVRTKTRAFEIVAALWHRSKATFSLEEWAKSESVLVLGNHPTARPTINALNRAIFMRVSEILIGGPEVTNQYPTRRRTWVVFDELAKSGIVDGLSDLLTLGRSKGCRIAIGFQDIDALSAVFTESGAKEICGMCDNKTILRLASPTTAAWAAQNIGDAEIREYTTTHAQSGSNDSYSEQIRKREAVMASELQNIPLAKDFAFTGMYITPAIGAYLAHLNAKPHLDPYGPEPGILERSVDDQYLDPWTSEDYSRLGLIDPGEYSLPATHLSRPRPNEFERISRPK